MLLSSNMFKFLVLGVFFWQQVVQDVFGQTESDIHNNLPTILSALKRQLKNDSRTELSQENDGKYNFHASQQIFYLSAFPWNRLNGITSVLSDDGKELPLDYIVTKGIGAHKLHLRRVKWNNARRYCVEEGGHLAVIRSDSEEKILRQMLVDNSIQDAWVGYHDNFEEGEWITVLDEPILLSGWGRWSRKYSINPDNFQGNQNCAQLLSAGGMDDLNCQDTRPFFCKIIL